MVVSQDVLKKRRELAKDLNSFMNIIWKELPNSDLSGISSAISDLNNSKYIPQIHNRETNPNIWGYDVPNLLFRFSSDPEKSKPYPLKKVELLLTVTVRGDANNLDTNNDPFESLNFDIILKGEHNQNRLMTSYHLDRHIVDEGDNHSLEAHPCYHFQFGGKKMIDEHGKALDSGSILFLDPPRISYHPMDLILGVDFLLSNFLPKNWNNLINNIGEYNALVEKYQKLFLKPHAISMASHWDRRVLNGDSLNWTPSKIHPQLK